MTSNSWPPTPDHSKMMFLRKGAEKGCVERGCWERLLTKAAAKACCERLLQKEAEKGCCERLLQNAAAKRCSERPLTKVAEKGCGEWRKAAGRWERLLRKAPLKKVVAQKGCWERLLRKAAEKSCCGRLLRQAAAKGCWERLLTEKGCWDRLLRKAAEKGCCERLLREGAFIMMRHRDNWLEFVLCILVLHIFHLELFWSLTLDTKHLGLIIFLQGSAHQS